MDADIFKKIDNSKNFYKGTDIIPKDDAFHGNINIIDVEWWYFDAVFDNGYSIHIGIRLYHLRNSGLLESRINIYKDGKVETETTKRADQRSLQKTFFLIFFSVSICPPFKLKC